MTLTTTPLTAAPQTYITCACGNPATVLTSTSWICQACDTPKETTMTVAPAYTGLATPILSGAEDALDDSTIAYRDEAHARSVFSPVGDALSRRLEAAREEDLAWSEDLDLEPLEPVEVYRFAVGEAATRTAYALGGRTALRAGYAAHLADGGDAPDFMTWVRRIARPFARVEQGLQAAAMDLVDALEVAALDEGPVELTLDEARAMTQAAVASDPEWYAEMAQAMQAREAAPEEAAPVTDRHTGLTYAETVEAGLCWGGCEVGNSCAACWERRSNAKADAPVKAARKPRTAKMPARLSDGIEHPVTVTAKAAAPKKAANTRKATGKGLTKLTPALVKDLRAQGHPLVKGVSTRRLLGGKVTAGSVDRKPVIAKSVLAAHGFTR